jgi:hypothetical protein
MMPERYSRQSQREEGQRLDSDGPEEVKRREYY